jgi:hypothetical protein
MAQLQSALTRDATAPGWTAAEDAAMAAFIGETAAALRPAPVRQIPVWRVVLATAATLALGDGLTVWRFRYSPPPTPSTPVAVAPQPTSTTVDFDGDRIIDIVDAYLYARQLKDQGIVPDYNGDHTHDEADVNIVADMAVHLPRQGDGS